MIGYDLRVIADTMFSYIKDVFLFKHWDLVKTSLITATAVTASKWKKNALLQFRNG